MNKLDEELKIALRREEPSADFAHRVLAQVRGLPPPKRGWRQSLLTLLRPPKVIWLAAGVAACLLVAIGVRGLRAYEPSTVEGPKIVASDANRQPEGASPVEVPKENVAPQPEPGTAPVKVKHVTYRHRRHTLRLDREEIEARQAMEQLELALYIASAKLNVAQRAVDRADRVGK